MSKKEYHGGTGTRLYRIWRGMRQRCFDKNASNYYNYGGRGITIMFTCFEDFRDWALGNGYKDSLSIDRVESNGPYSRDNCRWATRVEQNNNARSNRRLKFYNSDFTIAEWGKLLGIDRETLSSRIDKLGWSVAKTLTTPVQ